MAANNRIFYACQMVGLSGLGTQESFNEAGITVSDGVDASGGGGTGTGMPIAHGVQSVGITTNFNLEQAFELGQIQIYENIEGLPDVEVTMEKVLDGYPLLYHMATPSAEQTSLVGRSKVRCDAALGIFSDAFDSVTDSGSKPYPEVEVYLSGLYVGNISYTIPVDGNATESITLTGNNKEWITASGDMHITSNQLEFGEQSGYTKDLSGFLGSGLPDQPQALTDKLGGIQRRENVMLSKSILPQAIYGVSGKAKGNAWNSSTETPRVHIQNVSVSTDFSREDILELGRRTPYYRAPGFPIEVTCEIEAIAISGDFVAAYEEGDPAHDGTWNEGDNTSEETIRIHLQDGTVFDLGKKNRLSSVSYGGGDAAGGNVSITYSYANFNELDVLHPKDSLSGTKYTDEQLALINNE